MNVKITTLGCKVNQYESQVMLAALERAGFRSCEKHETADVAIVNSCTVTAASDAKVRQTLRRLKKENPDAVTVLTGCMPQAFPDEAADFLEADIVLGTKNRANLARYIMDYLSAKQRIVAIAPHETGDAFEDMFVDAFHERTRAFIKIQDGCNRFCSYCIIPYARGRVRSKPLADLKQEAAALAENGYREIVLAGINLSAYGQDSGLHLCDAVEAACIPGGIARVRLGSLEPERLSDDVIARLARQEKLCPQFHLSLQSGCDATLKRMNRHYTTAEYRAIVWKLRETFENAAVTTDIMVGFPGETDEEFAESLAFAEEISFAKAHVFAYSRRPGTAAYNAPGQLSNKIKETRSKEMTAVTLRSQQAFYKKQIGRRELVLFERAAAENTYEGYTMNYTPVRAVSDQSLQGRILPVRITGIDGNVCTADSITP